MTLEIKDYWRENPVEGALYVLVLVGALNWGLIGLGESGLVSQLVGSQETVDAVYLAVGAAGGVLLANDLGVITPFRDDEQ